MKCKKENFKIGQEINTASLTGSVDSIITTIINTSYEFALSKEESINPIEWESSIADFIEQVTKDLQQDIKQKVIDGLKLKLLSQGIIDNNEDPKQHIIDEEDSPIVKEEKKLSAELKSIFQDEIILQRKFLRKFEKDIYENSIIKIAPSIDDCMLITDQDDLNQAFEDYQEQAYETIYKYLQKIGLLKNVEIKQLFDNHDINPLYVENIRAFEDYLYKNLEEIRKHLYLDQELFQVISSYLTLQHFDKLIQQQIGKYFYINKNLTQPINISEGKTQYKYSINKKIITMATSWNVNEMRDGLKELGSFFNLIINQIPIIDSEETMNKSRFIMGFLKLKSAIENINSELPSIKNLKKAAANLNSNPIDSWITIIKIIHDLQVDGNIRNNLIKSSSSNNVLTDSDFTTFESVYQYLLNSTNGVYNIERKENLKGRKLGYSIICTLLGGLNSTVSVDYIDVTVKDGQMTIRDHPKYENTQEVFQLKKAIEGQVRNRDWGYENFKIVENGVTKQYNINIGDFSIEIPSKNSLGIFDDDILNFTVKYKGERIYLDQYFRDQLQKLFYEDGRKEILESVDGKNLEFLNLLRYIDSNLTTNFSGTSEDLQILRIFSKEQERPLHSLFLYSARVQTASYLNYKFKKFREDNDTNLNSHDLIKWAKVQENAVPFIGLKTLESRSSLIRKRRNGTYFLGIPSDSKLIDNLAKSRKIFQGDNNKSVTKNVNQDYIPNVSVAFTDIKQELGRQNTGVTKNLLFSGFNSSLLYGTKVDLEIETLFGKKSVDSLNSSELLQHFFIDNFVYAMQDLDADNSGTKHGLYLSQPITYSDKKKFLRFAVKLSDIPAYKDYAHNIFNIPKSVHINIIRNTIGKYYQNLLDKICDDYKVVFSKELQGITDNKQIFYKVNDLIKNMEADDLIKKFYDKKINIFEDLHFRRIGKILTLNETLFNYVYNIIPNIEQVLEKEKINYLNQFLSNHLFIRTDSKITKALSQACLGTKYKASDWIQDGNLVLAKRKNGENIVLSTSVNEEVEINPLLESYFYIHNVIDNNLKLNLSGHELHHTIKSLKKLSIGLNDDEIQYLGEKTSSLIEIEQALDSVLVKDKKLHSSIKQKLNIAYNKLLSLAQNAQFKRTVPIPGTMRLFDQDRIDGIAKTYKCAVIEDLNASTYDYLGNYGYKDASAGVEAHDGSAWIDPFTSILENNSLDDQDVGDVRKPLWDIDEPQLGCRRLVKYASNTITNRIMLQSLKSDLNMYKMFKKMTKERWNGDIDLIDDWAIIKHDKNSFRNIITGKENLLYYIEGDTQKQILDFGKEIDSNGRKVYYTLEVDVDSKGIQAGESYKVYHYFDADQNHIKSREQLENFDHTIDSLFELHSALGGIFSASKINGKIQYSESSNRAVSQFMIYVSKPTENYKNFTGGNNYRNGVGMTINGMFEQPLKTRLINCLINKSAIKNGASNVNSVDSFFDDKDLMYDTYSTVKYGIQQDSDHTADEGKVTEMTQVISALDATGFYHDEVLEIYNALGRQTLNALKVEMDSMDNYDQLYDIIGKTIINNISNEKGLVKAVMEQINKHFSMSANHKQDEIKIPFSDRGVYTKILNVLGGLINRKAIKRKYPGLGQVMVPSYGIYQIWEIQGKKYQFLDLVNLALQDPDTKPYEGNIPYNQYLSNIVELYLDKVSPNTLIWNNGEMDLSSIDPTNNLIITYNTKEGKNKTVKIKLDSLYSYYQFKENPNKYLKDKYKDFNTLMSIYKDNKSPRDLAPTRIRINYIENGVQKSVNIFDTWVYKNLYELSKNPKENEEKIREYREYYIPGFLKKLEEGVYVKDPILKLSFSGVTVINQPAETIMSNIYKSKFGIDEFTEFNDVDIDSFKIKPHYIDSDIYKYDLALITGNNSDNIYISFDVDSEVDKNYLRKPRFWRSTNKSLKTTSQPNIQRVFYMDDDNIEQFEIGRNINVSEEIYYDNETSSYKYRGSDKTVEKERKLFKDSENNVWEYIEFVSKYNISPVKGSSFIKYEINQDNINKVLLNKETVDDVIADIVDQMYHSQSYLLITPGSKVSVKNYLKIRNVLDLIKNKNINSDIAKFLDNIVSNIFTISNPQGKGYINLDKGDIQGLKTYILRNGDMFNLELQQSGLPVLNIQDPNFIKIVEEEGDFINKLFQEKLITKEHRQFLRNKLNSSKLIYYKDKYIENFAKNKYSSFQLSRFFVSSRIPAQTLQSFMAMENVGYNGVNTNYCAVSHFQTFLQGSDYDIDKSFMLGFGFDNNGLLIGWSDLFDYSSLETLKESLELPLVTNNQKFFNTDSGKDITFQAMQIAIEQDPVKKLRLKINLIKELGDRRDITIKDHPELIQPTLQFLNKHAETKLGMMEDGAIKNFVAYKIQKLIQKLQNLPNAYTPVEMNDLREAMKDTPKAQLASSFTLFNPAMVSIMQNQNMVGKQVTGIAANGQKALFMWRFGMLDTLLHSPENEKYVIMDINIDRVSGRYNENPGVESIPKNEHISILPDLNNLLENKKDSLTTRVKSDNLGSQYISAATDNAKELILAAINSGNKLAKCHLYLLALGFDVKDIVSFMSSKAVSFIDSITDDNIYNGTNIQIQDAIDFAKKYLQYKTSLLNSKEEENSEKIRKQMKALGIKGGAEILANVLKQELDSISDIEGFIKDLNSFENINVGATEFSAFGRTLGINQGIPQTKEDLEAFKNKLTTIINVAIKRNKLLDKNGKVQYSNAIQKFIQENYPAYIDSEGKLLSSVLKSENQLLKGETAEKWAIRKFTEKFQEVLNFDINRWLNDQDYKDLTSEYYNYLKHSINIFYFIDTIPHYKAMFQAANFLNKTDSKISLKSKLLEYYSKQLRSENTYLPDTFEKRLLNVIDEIILGKYIKSLGLRIKIKEGWNILDSSFSKTVATSDQYLNLFTDSDFTKFKYVFENIVKELKNGTLIDEDLSNNDFIRELILSEDSKSEIPLYKANIDLMLINSNEEVQNKYIKLMRGLKELQHYEYDGIPLSDLFMLYNIIVNKNQYGSERLTQLFEDFILDYDKKQNNSSLLIRALMSIGEQDYTKQYFQEIIDTIPPRTLLLAASPVVYSTKGKEDPYVVIFDENKGFVFYKKHYNEYRPDSNIKLLQKSRSETVREFIERQINYFEYGYNPVQPKYIDETIQMLKDDFDFAFGNLIQNLIVNYKINCE